MVLKNRGVFFTIDAILATSIILIVIILASSYYITETKTETMDHLSHDLLRVLTNLKVDEIDNNFTQTLIAEGNITRHNNSILEQIGEFWAENQAGIATELARNVTDSLVPERFGVGFWVNDELIYQRDKNISNALISSRKIITGIEKEKPRFGYSSRAFLKSINRKTMSSYAYFGGFVGQGNITKNLEHIPSDAIIMSSYLEMDAGTSFDFYINDNFCNAYTPTRVNMSSTGWNISSCNPLIQPGIKNNLSIIFTGLFNESFVGGGYMRVKYQTQELIRNETPGIQTYEFPGIYGLINLYSSISIPGTLKEIDLYLHFYNNKTTYLNIGNETVIKTFGSSSDQIINISGLSMAQTAATIPIRMGVENISEFINTTSGEPADIVLVTDVSGSMDDCGMTGVADFCTYDCYWFFLFLGTRECIDPGTCSNDECGTCSGWGTWTDNHQVVNQNGCLKTKLELAQEADLEFVATVLNVSGNEIGLVSYEESVDSTEAITNIKINLDSEISSYDADGGTCICCGINNAKDMLLPSNDDRFMVVMSDGEANYYCDDFFDYTGTWDSNPGYPTAISTAIGAGQNACDKNITVFSVGFGADADHDTLKQIACNESLYYNASNSSRISEIYQIIGNQIIVIANYSSQVITLTGDYRGSTLYPDSYIRFNYTPAVSPATFGEIEIVVEEDKFKNCSPFVNIPQDTRVSNANVLSYSGSHWTSYLSINANEVFNINDFGTEYTDIGDPFVVQIPPNLVQNGDNQLFMQTADNPDNQTGCSLNNTMIYDLLIKSNVDYGDPLVNASGCIWNIELESGIFRTLKSPLEYIGSDECNYTSTGSNYKESDAYDVAVFAILRQLDFEDNGKVDVDFDENDLIIDYVTITNVPSLWGPAIVELRIWD